MCTMKFFKGYMTGIFCGIVTLYSCAATVNYKYYTPSMPDDCYDHGQLLGKLGNDGWPDLPLSECKPDDTPNGKAKCAVQLLDDYFKKDIALKTCEQKLSDCQGGPPPNN